MPPPSNLPSLARSHGQSIIQTSDNNSNNSSSGRSAAADQSNINTGNGMHAGQQQLSQSGGSTTASGDQTPVTIAAVVSGNSATSTPTGLIQPMNVAANQQSWPTPLVASQITEAGGQHAHTHANDEQRTTTYKTYSNTTKWGQNEFPNLADAALLTQQQNQQKQQTQSAAEQQHQQLHQQQQQGLANNNSNAQYNNGPVLKPSSKCFYSIESNRNDLYINAWL